jgi:peroxiredoxin
MSSRMLSCASLASALFTAALFAATPSFHLQDTGGAWHDAAEWRSARAVVLLFISIDCPINNSYAPEFQRLNSEYSGRGVRFYAVQPDPDRTAEDVRKYAADFGYTFPVLLDSQQLLTRATGATVMPQAMVLSARGEVLYSGRIDDRQISIGKSRYKATRNDLRDALEAVLAGKRVPHARTQPVGCVIPTAQM